MNNQLTKFRGCWLTMKQIDKIYYLESQKKEKDWRLPKEFLPWWRIIKDKNFFLSVYGDCGGSESNFTSIIKNSIEEKQRSKKNVYTGKVVSNQSLFK